MMVKIHREKHIYEMVTVIDVCRKHFNLKKLTKRQENQLNTAVGKIVATRWSNEHILEYADENGKVHRIRFPVPNADVPKTHGGGQRHKKAIYPVKKYEKIIIKAYIKKAADLDLPLKLRKKPRTTIKPRRCVRVMAYVEIP